MPGTLASFAGDTRVGAEGGEAGTVGTGVGADVGEVGGKGMGVGPDGGEVGDIGIRVGVGDVDGGVPGTPLTKLKPLASTCDWLAQPSLFPELTHQ